MATGKDGAVGRQLRTLFNVGLIRDLTDGQLLERFATSRGEGSELAFAALVERHGTMVLRVAQGVLDNPHDAQDAFQATFLVLVSKARGLWVRDSLGPWLHQVAYRTATCLRSNLARRKRLERRAALIEETSQPQPADDLARVLLEEVDRLPERYRAPVVLCDLEGRTHEQAARALGWPIGTVKSRQSRARDKLRDRLRLRGVAPGLAPLAAWPAIDAPLSARLLDQTTAAAVRFIPWAIAPGTAAALAREVVRSMMILQWTKAGAVLLALGVTATGGAGLIAQGQKPGDDSRPIGQKQAEPTAEPAVMEAKPGKLTWTIVERGNLEPSRSRDVICEVEGTTTIISIVPEGAVVKQGDVVAELDSALLRDTLTNQRITVQQAEAAYKQARLVREVAEHAVREYNFGVYPQDLASLKGRVANARAGLEKAQTRLERTKAAQARMDTAKIRRPGPETPSDVLADLAIADKLDEAELDIQARKLDLDTAQTQQLVLEQFTREKQIKGLEVDVEHARSDELRRQSSWTLEQTKAKKLERQIEKCRLMAPGDGTLIYANDPGRANAMIPRSQIEEGATVRERQKIFSVFVTADPIRVNTKVHESIVDQVLPGMRVKIKVDALPNESLTGTVRSVAPMADTRIVADGTKVYTTFIEVDKSPHQLPLRPGMSARAEILIRELDNVISVPITALVRFEDEKYQVAVKAPAGGVEWRDVTLGLATDTAVEIKQGLKAGDLLILDPQAQMTEAKKNVMLPIPGRTPARKAAAPR